MQVVKLRFNGTCPLLMHSDRGANPLDKDRQDQKKITSKMKKTDDDLLAVAWGEFRMAIYFDEKIGPFIPAQNIDGAIQGGAKSNKLGKKFASSARCVEDKVRLDYEGPRTIEGLYKGGFVDVRSVRIGKARVMRARPIFPQWSLTFELAFDETELDESNVILAAETAGRLVGLGDFRPRFGRFDVEVMA